MASYAETLTVSRDLGASDPGRQRHGDDESTAAFVITLDAINFGSGYFPYLRKRAGLSGHHTIASGLRDFVQEGNRLTGPWLRSIDESDCAELFGQPRDGYAGELMGLFAQALRDLGGFVGDHGDSFTETVRAADQSAASLVERWSAMPLFRDVSTYRGFDVPLYKRAQITAYDLARAFDGEGLGAFHDIGELTMFADNLVPHVLRVDGVLVFDPALVARIDAVDDITSGSEEEVEIRAVALDAVEQLRKCLAATSTPLTSAEIDAVLWERGAGARYKAVPRHRTRCTYY